MNAFIKNLKELNPYFLFSIIILLLINMGLLLFAIQRQIAESNNGIQGYVSDNKITVVQTLDHTCMISELTDKICLLSIPKNQKVDIIYDGKNGWMYGNWKYGEISVWGWVRSDSLLIQ